MFPKRSVFKIRIDFVVVAHFIHVVCHIFYALDNFSHHVAIDGQRLHPARQIEINRLYGKFKQNGFQNLADVVLVHIKRVFYDDGCVVLLFKLFFEILRAFRIDVCNVKHDYKRLFALFKLGYNPLFRLDVVLAFYRAETTVGGDCKRNGAMLFDDLLRADFRRFRKRHILV